MANCADFLAEVVASDQVTTLDRLNHNTLSVVVFARNSCKSFYMKFDVFTVVDFTANLNASPSVSFSYDVKMYRVTGKTLTEIATTTSTDQSAMFSKEFTAGTYLVCFQTTTATTLTGTVLPVFRGYQRYAVIDADFGEGSAFTATFDNRRPPADCSAELLFELIEGSLPPGIRMNSAGFVLGVAPNLDCIDDTAALPPAQNWSFEHNDGTYHPWGKQWRFKVRVSIAEMPETFAEEWFCVKIHNNWSLDRDNFLTQAPFWHDIYEEEVEAITIPDMCPKEEAVVWEPQVIVLPCPDGSPPKFEVEKIPDPGCPSCTGQEAVQTFPMPFGVPSIGSAGFEQWLTALEGDDCPEVKAFVVKFKASPIYAMYLRDEPVEITQEYRDLVLRTYVDDPNRLFLEWRLAENQRLPWTIDAVGGMSITFSLDTRPRQYF